MIVRKDYEVGLPMGPSRKIWAVYKAAPRLGGALPGKVEIVLGTGETREAAIANALAKGEK